MFFSLTITTFIHVSSFNRNLKLYAIKTFILAALAAIALPTFATAQHLQREITYAYDLLTRYPKVDTAKDVLYIINYGVEFDESKLKTRVTHDITEATAILCVDYAYADVFYNTPYNVNLLHSVYVDKNMDLMYDVSTSNSYTLMYRFCCGDEECWLDEYFVRESLENPCVIDIINVLGDEMPI